MERKHMNSEQIDFSTAGPSGEAGFIDEKGLLARLPVSRRTLGNWKATGILPYIKIGRRCLYDCPGGSLLIVTEALVLRHGKCRVEGLPSPGNRRILILVMSLINIIRYYS